jgi:hypothetical protein
VVTQGLISPLLRSDFAQSTAGRRPNGDLTDSFVPGDGKAVLNRASGARPDPGAEVTDMQTSSAIERPDSPDPGIVPEPVDAEATPTNGASPTKPARTMLAKLLSVIRGDEYMADAYPPATAAQTKER